jgi:hypothetical protein
MLPNWCYVPLSHACSASATHDISSIVVSTTVPDKGYAHLCLEGGPVV